MRTCLLLLAVLVAIFMFLVMIPLFAKCQEIIGVVPDGTCRDFVVTITADGLGESCWDVKLDVPGSVNDGRAWRSSFYYVDRAICWPDKSADIPVRLDSTDPVIESSAKMRQGSRVIEQVFTIRQSCPKPLADNWVILVSILIILVFGWSLVWWWKRK